MTYMALTYLHNHDARLHITIGGLCAAKMLLEICTKHGTVEVRRSASGVAKPRLSYKQLTWSLSELGSNSFILCTLGVSSTRDDFRVFVVHTKPGLGQYVTNDRGFAVVALCIVSRSPNRVPNAQPSTSCSTNLV